MKKKILMIGQGAWATAISNLLSNNGHQVVMLCQDQNVKDEINQKKTNQAYAPELQLLVGITAITLSDLNKQASYDFIFQAIPMPFLNQIIFELRSYCNNKIPWISLSKGIDNDGNTGSVIIKKVINPSHIGVLAGPSFADYLNQEDITAVMLAATNQLFANEVALLLKNSFFKLYHTDDLYGLECCSAAKNSIAIFAGLLDSLGYHDNSKALFFVKSIEQLKQGITALGGLTTTVNGIGGIGDLFLTFSGSVSKNRKFGTQLGSYTIFSQKNISEKYICEGINTTKTFKELLDKNNVSLSIISTLYEILYNNAPIAETVKKLFQSW